MDARRCLPLGLLVQLFFLIWDPSGWDGVKEEGVSHLCSCAWVLGSLARAPDDDGVQARDSPARPPCPSSTPHRPHRHLSPRLQRVPQQPPSQLRLVHISLLALRGFRGAHVPPSLASHLTPSGRATKNPSEDSIDATICTGHRLPQCPEPPYGSRGSGKTELSRILHSSNQESPSQANSRVQIS